MSDKRPNIVVAFADQMRGMDMRCAGNRDVLTPNLDKLTTEGIMFTNAYANSPVCTPSRGSLLTGLYPLSHRAITNDVPISEEVPSIAKILKKEGYRTGYVGKWHLDGVPRSKFTPPGPRRHGFEDYWAVWNCSHNYFGAYYFEDTPKKVAITGYEPRAQTDLAIEFIEKRDERPFCLFVSWGPPHDPYFMVPDRYKRMYDPNELTMRLNIRPTSEVAQKVLGRYDAVHSYKETIANYYAAITALDEQMGRILDVLEKTGIASDTIILFTSDHGDMLWSQGMLKKEQPWEESISIPFIIRWPGHIAANRKSGELFSIVDVMPSLLGLIELRAENVHGTNLSPLIMGREQQCPESVFIMEIKSIDEGYSQGLKEWRGVRTKRYIYACTQGRKDWILYDNDSDPYQMKNLIDEPEYRQIKEELRSKLQDWLKCAGDRFMSGDEHIKELGLTKLWNERELHMAHPRAIQD